MTENWNLLCQIYKHLESCNCLCVYGNCTEIQILWHTMYQKSFKEGDTSRRDECQMLCVSLTRLTAEIYIDSLLHYNHVCKNLQELLKIFLSEELWNIFIYHLKCSKDRYMMWTFIKSFSVILCTCDESVFTCRIRKLLNDTKENVFEVNNTHVFEFLSSIVDYTKKPSNTCIKADSCKNVISVRTPSLKGLFQNFCMILSKYWNTFMKQFHEVITAGCVNQSLNEFLILWQKLIGGPLKDDLLHMFLHEDCVNVFLSKAYNLPVIPLQIYSDIIMQFFTSSFIFKIREEKRNNSLEEAVITALENNFFSLLPQDCQISSFCVSRKCQSENSSVIRSSQKNDPVIVKKVAFIFLSALTDMKKTHLLWDSVQKVFYFVKDNFNIPLDECIHTWIFDVFIDHDDILIGVMHSLLKIYLLLKDESSIRDNATSKYFHIQNDLNPHAVFIGFLQRIGFEHSEMLAFLTTDEACFLLYLTQYLKVLLQEWESFIKIHETVIKNDSTLGFSLSSQSSGECSKVSYSPSIKKSLVAYSSSSSDEDVELSEIISQTKTASYKNFIVITTLIRLKGAIQKLVDVDKFPYKASPLIALLQACEEHSFKL